MGHDEDWTPIDKSSSIIPYLPIHIQTIYVPPIGLSKPMPKLVSCDWSVSMLYFLIQLGYIGLRKRGLRDKGHTSYRDSILVEFIIELPGIASAKTSG